MSWIKKSRIAVRLAKMLIWSSKFELQIFKNLFWTTILNQNLESKSNSSTIIHAIIWEWKFLIDYEGGLLAQKSEVA